MKTLSNKNRNTWSTGWLVAVMLATTACGQMAQEELVSLNYEHAQSEEELFSSWWESVASWLG